MTLPNEAMAVLFDAALGNDLPVDTNYNVCPTNRIAVLTSDAGSRRLVAQRWGFIPHWYKAPNDGPLLINARGESVAKKPAFAKACRERRCLIPASGYYEWTKDEAGKRLPWYISPVSDGPLVFGGIWQMWQDQPTCAIVTVAAGETLSALHHREPLVVAPDDWAKWLGEDGHGAANLMHAAPEGALRYHRVSTAVNSNRASGPELIEPI